MATTKHPEATFELRELTNPKPDEKDSIQMPAKKSCWFRNKYVMIALACASAVILIGLLAWYLVPTHTKVDEYEETQYSIKVNTEITTKVGTKTTTTNDELDLTIFGLDMKGQEYNLMIVNGIESEDSDKSAYSAPADLFMSFDVSKNAEILESRYFQEKFSNETVTLFSGIIQGFVVDQDSPFEVDSECKKTKKGSTECTKNSKKKEGKKTYFKKYGKSQEDTEDSEEELEYTSKTLINEHGKIEGSKIEGKFSKKYNNQGGEQFDFEVKATIVVVSSKKLTKEQIKTLNEIDKKLPKVECESEQKQKKFINEVNEEPNEYDDSELPESLSDVSHIKRSLSRDDERSLFDNTVTYKYFTFYDIPFYLNSRMYSGYDSSYKYWVCGIHRFVFGSIEMKLLNTDFCISSNYVRASSRTAYTKWSQKASLKAYIYTVKFSVFTISLYSQVGVNNVPYVESYYNTYGNTVTKMNVVATISVSVTGEASVGVAKGGVTFTNSMKSNINDYMVGYTSPFAAYVYLDKSFEGKFQIWVKYLTLSKSCYTVFGIKFCIPSVKYSDKVSLFSETYTYKYYPEVQLFYSAF